MQAGAKEKRPKGLGRAPARREDEKLLGRFETCPLCHPSDKLRSWRMGFKPSTAVPYRGDAWRSALGSISVEMQGDVPRPVTRCDLKAGGGA